MKERLRQLEARLEDLSRIVPLAENILTQLLRSSPPPTRLATLQGLLRSARQLEQHGEVSVIEQVLEQSEAGIQSLRQWLALADLAISPFVLRSYLERNPPDTELHKALIRYFLEKSPHAESDRDKLDYLLTAHFTVVRETDIVARFESPAELAGAIAELFRRPVTGEMPSPVQMMLHELESLMVLVTEFQDFDQLVAARMVERARALKANLGENFYDPKVLPTIIRFNITFRRHFEQLIRKQIEQVKAQTGALIEAVRQIFPAIETAFQALATSPGTRIGAGTPEPAGEAGSQRFGRPLELADERQPIDQLSRRAADPQKESELRGIIKRIGRHIAGLKPAEAAASRIPFPLRHTSIELYEWEREAFAPAAEGQAPTSARTVQFSLGLIAWMEEEYALYEKTRGDRYQWKPHFDLLSYAVERAHDQFHTIHGLLQAGGPAQEAAWFPALVNIAGRLLQTLEKLAPVFT